MDCGDGVTVNVCSSDDDCNSSANGPKLTTTYRPELFAVSDSDAHSPIVSSNDGKTLKYVTPAGNVTVVNLLHPQSYEILARVQDSLSSDIATSDTTDSHSSTKSITENNDNNTDTITESKQTSSGQVLKLDSDDTLQNGSQNQHQAVGTQQLQHRESISCGIEESTEVLLINSTDCNDKYFGAGRAYSATDSDVEVLMSEEIAECDWSAGGTATGEHTPEDVVGDVTTTKVADNNQKQSIMTDSDLVKEESTDQEISIENSCHSSLSISEQFDKENLLKIIGEQAASIHKLKSVVEHYRRTHLMLSKHAEAIQFTIDMTDADLEKLGFPPKIKP